MMLERLRELLAKIREGLRKANSGPDDGSMYSE